MARRIERDDFEEPGFRTPRPPIPSTPAPPGGQFTYPAGEHPNPGSLPLSSFVQAPEASTSGGGGFSFGGFGPTPNFAAQDPAKKQSDFTWGVLKGIISGNDLPFGEKEIALEKGQAKTASENTFSQAKDEIQAQQAATGFASSPAALRPIVEARIGASQQFGAASNDIAQNAAQQNFNARLAALNNAQSWIDSLRSYVAQMTGTWVQKQQAEAALRLAQAQLNEQMRQFDISTAIDASRG